MNVANYMTKNPITARADLSLADARELMKREKIHRLPVVDNSGHLVGIVTEKDILYATPSSMTTLDVYEIHSLFAKLKIKDAMTKDVVSITPETHIEEAARIMADNNIGGLTVVKDKVVQGIITESDIFKVMMNMFGIREKGYRITLLLPEKKGELAELTSAVSSAGGNIISFLNVPGENITNALAVMKVKDIDRDTIVNILKPLAIELREIEEV